MIAQSGCGGSAFWEPVRIRQATQRLELLRELAPDINRIAVLWNPANPSAAPQLKDTDGLANGAFARVTLPSATLFSKHTTM